MLINQHFSHYCKNCKNFSMFMFERLSDSIRSSPLFSLLSLLHTFLLSFFISFCFTEFFFKSSLLYIFALNLSAMVKNEHHIWLCQKILLIRIPARQGRWSTDCDEQYVNSLEKKEKEEEEEEEEEEEDNNHLYTVPHYYMNYCIKGRRQRRRRRKKRRRKMATIPIQ